MARAAARRVIADRYALNAPLGRGEMGVVWRAQDAVLGREVAVKEVVFPPTMADDERRPAQARVLREARAAARLNHPGAVTLYDVVQDHGGTFIVMELVSAPTLAELVRAEGPLPVERVAEIGAQVASALEAAHLAGIVHRDVKPGNVMVPDQGVAKLADFGIASLQGDPQLTSTGLVIGSPAYMAPEQAKGEESGPPADFWALGATMFYAVEGEPPFDRGTSIATLAAVVNDPPPPPAPPRRCPRPPHHRPPLQGPRFPPVRPGAAGRVRPPGRRPPLPAHRGPPRPRPRPHGPPPGGHRRLTRPRRLTQSRRPHGRPRGPTPAVQPRHPADRPGRLRTRRGRGCGQPGAPQATLGYPPESGAPGPAGRGRACRHRGRRGPRGSGLASRSGDDR